MTMALNLSARHSRRSLNDKVGGVMLALVMVVATSVSSFDEMGGVLQ